MPDEVSRKDRDDLHAFLVEVHELLAGICRGQIQLKDQPTFRQEDRSFILAAFSEYEETGALANYEAAAYRTPAKKLRDGGLVGAQWKLKRRLFERLRDKFKDFPVRKTLLRLLSAIDNAVDTFVVLAGVKHALKELKDTLSGYLEDAGDEK